MEDNTPFGIGQDLIVEIPVDPRGTVDLYVDDFCGLMVDIDDNATRLERAPFLAFEKELKSNPSLAMTLQLLRN